MVPTNWESIADSMEHVVSELHSIKSHTASLDDIQGELHELNENLRRILALLDSTPNGKKNASAVNSYRFVS
jgi:hypothetical protein